MHHWFFTCCKVLLFGNHLYSLAVVAGYEPETFTYKNQVSSSLLHLSIATSDCTLRGAKNVKRFQSDVKGKKKALKLYKEIIYKKLCCYRALLMPTFPTASVNMKDYLGLTEEKSDKAGTKRLLRQRHLSTDYRIPEIPSLGGGGGRGGLGDFTNMLSAALRPFLSTIEYGVPVGKTSTSCGRLEKNTLKGTDSRNFGIF
jgi:hypothetical protein